MEMSNTNNFVTTIQHNQAKQLQGYRLGDDPSLSVARPFRFINTPALNFRFCFARFAVLK
jgi:hypothetical protein